MPRLILDGDARGAVRAMADLSREVAKGGAEFDKTAKQARELEKAAARIVKENDGPQGRYNAKIKELAQLVNAGKLTFDQAGIAARRYGAELDRAGKRGMSAFGPQVLASLKSYVGGLATVAAAVSAIRHEWDAVIDRQRQVTQVQLTAADARDVLKRNIFGLGNAERQRVLAQADQLAATTKLPQRVIDTALAQTISARGGNTAEAVAFLSFATKFTRDQESIGEFAGALGDIANALGTNDPKRALGFLGIASQQARPTDLRQVARNLPKLTQAVRGAGGDPRYGGALFAGITVGAADPQGEISRTAGIRLTQKIGEFFKDDPRGYLRDQVDTFDEQIGVLMRDRKLASQFLDKATFEAGAQPAIRSMFLDPKSAARRSFESAYVALGTPADQAAAGARGVEFLAGGKLARTRLAEQTVESGMERYRLGVNAEFSPERREEIRELSRAVQGVPSLLQRGAFAVRTGPTLDVGEAIRELTFALKNQPGRFSLFRDETAINTAVRLLEDLKEISAEQTNVLRSLDKKTRDRPVPSGRQE